MKKMKEFRLSVKHCRKDCDNCKIYTDRNKCPIYLEIER